MLEGLTEVFKFKRFILALFVCVLITLALVAPAVAAGEERERLPVQPGFYGYPLKIFRILKKDQSFPEAGGLYVTSVDPTAYVYEKRLEEEAIITEVAGEEVNYMPRVREVLNEHAGQEIEIKGYRLAPSYVKQRRENPFFEYRGGDPYRRFSFEITYPVRYVPEPEPVYVYEDGELYHKQGYQHSPDTTVNGREVESPAEAREEGYEPCPFGFPGGSGGPDVTSLVEDELPGGADIMKKLKKKFGLRQDLPAGMIRLREKIFPQRLRTDIEPRILFLDTQKFYALSNPDGQIIISRGLWSYLEFEAPRAFLLACLLGHVDFKHRFGLPGEEYLIDLIKRGLDRVSGQVSGLKMSHFAKVEEMLPVYLRTSYRSMVEKGFSQTEEKQALFLGMVYLYRAGLNHGAASDYLTYIQDVVNYPHPQRMEFQLQRPLPERFRSCVKNWRKLIPKKFSRPGGNSSTVW